MEKKEECSELTGHFVEEIELTVRSRSDWMKSKRSLNDSSASKEYEYFDLPLVYFTNGRFKFLIDTNCFKTDVYFIFLRINKNCFFLRTLLKSKCNHRLRRRTWRKHRDARIFPEARYDIDPTRFPDSAESARGERKIKKKRKTRCGTVFGF